VYAVDQELPVNSCVNSTRQVRIQGVNGLFNPILLLQKSLISIFCKIKRGPILTKMSRVLKQMDLIY